MKVADAVKDCDVVMILVPDEIQVDLFILEIRSKS